VRTGGGNGEKKEKIFDNILIPRRSLNGNRVKKNKLDAKLILSIFRQPLHVSDVSKPIIRRYNRMYTTVGTYYYYYFFI